jgi:hypothetical protein
MSWREWDDNPLMFRVAIRNVSVIFGLRGSGSGISVFQCFPLVKVGVFILFRFRSWVLSLFLSTCSFFFRVVPVVNLSTGMCSVHESVQISVYLGSRLYLLR